MLKFDKKIRRQKVNVAIPENVKKKKKSYPAKESRVETWDGGGHIPAAVVEYLDKEVLLLHTTF